MAPSLSSSTEDVSRKSCSPKCKSEKSEKISEKSEKISENDEEKKTEKTEEENGSDCSVDYLNLKEWFKYFMKDDPQIRNDPRYRLYNRGALIANKISKQLINSNFEDAHKNSTLSTDAPVFIPKTTNQNGKSSDSSVDSCSSETEGGSTGTVILESKRRRKFIPDTISSMRNYSTSMMNEMLLRQSLINQQQQQMAFPFDHYGLRAAAAHHHPPANYLPMDYSYLRHSFNPFTVGPYTNYPYHFQMIPKEPSINSDPAVIAAQPSKYQQQQQKSGRTPKHCVYCKSINESPDMYESHCLKNPITGKIICPLLRDHVCENCGATGDDAHMESRCPFNLIKQTNSDKSKTQSKSNVKLEVQV